MADEKDDAQLKNAISAIKVQLTATANPAELARLGSEAAGLLSSTNNPDLIKEITSLQASITTKEETAQNRVSSGINAQNIAAEAAEQTPQELAERQKLEDLHNEHERINAQHKTFLKTADKYLEERQKENEKKEELLKDFREGKDVDPERLKSFIKTPEQIQAEKEQLDSFRKHQAEADKHHADALVQEEEMQKARVKTAQELEERRNAIKNRPPAEREKETLKLKPPENRLAQQDTNLADIKLKVQKTGEIKATADKRIEEVEKKRKKSDELEEEIKKEVEKDKEKNPQKYNKSMDFDFDDLLNNQTATINKTDSSKKPVDSQEETPANQEVAPSARPLPTKESHTLGDKALELQKKSPIPPDEIKKLAGEIKVSLVNSQNTSVISKENEVNKQMARTAQQNKNPKNKGHGR